MPARDDRAKQDRFAGRASYDAACIAGMALSSEAASVPIPKFASLCGAVACELRNQRDTSDLLSGAVGVGSHSARLRRERFPVWRPPLAAPASALSARTTGGGMETRVGYFILLGRTSSSAGRSVTFGTFDGQFITFGTFVALEGVSSSMTGNRGLSDALVGSGAVALVEPGSTMPAATSAPTIAATAVIKPAMAVSTPGNVVQNPTAGFSSPMDQTPLCVSATPTGEPDETSASIAHPVARCGGSIRLMGN